MRRRAFLSLALVQAPSITLSLKEPFERRLELARKKLERGQHLNQAISLLESCLKEKPGRFDLHLDLACACAGRAHVLARAQIDTIVHDRHLTKYEEELEEWEKAQHNPESILYRVQKPLPLLEVRTSDDNLRFKLSSEEVISKICSYSERALSEISQAEKLLLPDLEKDQIQFYYVSAWVQAILWRYPRSLTEKVFPVDFKVEKIIANMKKISSFESSGISSRLVISDFLYYINDHKDFQSFNGGLVKKLIFSSTPERGDEAIRLFREYIESKKGKSPVFELRLSIMQQDNELQGFFQKQKSKKEVGGNSLDKMGLIFAGGLSVYEEIANNNTDNSILWYCYATKLLSNDKRKEAWEAIVRGNAMPIGEFLEYTLSAPRLLAWAVPTQVLIPQHFEILMSTLVDAGLNERKGSDSLKNIEEIIKISNKIEEASMNEKYKEENRKKLRDAVFWMKSTLLTRVILFQEKNPDGKINEEILGFMRNNRREWNRAVKSLALFRRYNQ
jgi:hypothetical protein